MKKIQKLAVLLGLAPIVVFSSCSNDFLDRKPTTALETSMVLTDPDMAPTTVVGSMAMFSGYGFMGRNGIIGGELMTDVATTMGKSGHLQDLEKWNIHSNMDELAGFWSYCYAVSASATQTAFSCKQLLADSTKHNLSSAQKNTLRNAIACSKVIRAYCDFYLLQYFCVDYQLKESLVPGNHKNRKVGVVLIGDQPLGINAPANMSTLEACYASIEKTLEEAIAYFEESNTKTYIPAPESRYFPTLCAAYVLQARVFLAKGKEYFGKALEAVDNAEANLPSGTSMNLISNYETLYEGYKSATATSEDIWTINYTSQDNLSANSLQNFFGSYNCAISENITNKFKANDFRKYLYPAKPDKESRCLKYPNSTGVFNVPVMRVPELYLIRAEIAANNADNGDMIAALYNILKARDTSVHSEEDIRGGSYNYGNATSKEEMINIVLDERVKEYAGEGYRWSDLRRNARHGVRLNRPGLASNPSYLLHFGNYNLARFALPVPFDETSTEQWQKGHGILDNGELDTHNPNWQNNAWEEPNGGLYGVSEKGLIPEEGEGLNKETGNVEPVTPETW